MADYKGFLADLRAQMSALDRERTKLEAAITAMEALVNTAKPSGSASAVAVAPRAYANLHMPSAIEKYLLQAGHPQTKPEIQAALKAGGIRASAKSFSAHVYNTLHRHSKEGGLFYRQADGRWGLSAWKQPGLLETAG